MNINNLKQLEDLIVEPDEVLDKIKPGMSIFLGTGMAEPKTLIKHLMQSDKSNLQDLELIQLISLGDAIFLKELKSHKYRLKTFFSGWVANEAIASGRIDFIPTRFSRIPNLIRSKKTPVDVAFIQITPLNDAGYCSLGVAIDVAREAMERATLVVGEINSSIPRTLGDTFVPISDFDFIVRSTEPPFHVNRWPVSTIYDKIASKIANIIEDGSCMIFSLGPLFDALSPHLQHKKNLGVHSPIFTDALMDLVNSGAVTNRNKKIFQGKSLTSYAIGTAELFTWLDNNPLIEFQSVEKVYNALQLGANPKLVSIIHTHKVDLAGRIALPVGKNNIASEPAEVIDFVIGAGISDGGYTMFALPSRNLKGESNIMVSIKNYPNQLSVMESVDFIVTEYGVASLMGRTVRERAQALIDIAHPDDKETLINQAKKENMIYQDQIFISQTTNNDSNFITTEHIFKNDIAIKFRQIKPSDEEEMRRLFYRFTDKEIYYRYFTPLKTMTHSKMQEYVNIDYEKVTSIVGISGAPTERHIVAEARFIINKTHTLGDVAFVVDSKYNKIGVATYMYSLLVEYAKKKGLKGFTADVLSSNRGMMKVFEKGGQTIKASLSDGVYELQINF